MQKDVTMRLLAVALLLVSVLWLTTVILVTLDVGEGQGGASLSSDSRGVGIVRLNVVTPPHEAGASVRLDVIEPNGG